MSGKGGEAWWKERSTGEKAVIVIFFVFVGIGLLFLFGAVVMWLWNWLMPEIFGLPELSYWQSWGLLILSSILFKNIDFGSDDRKSRRQERKRKEKLREYMQEEAESDEEVGGSDQESRSEDADRTESEDGPSSDPEGDQ